MPTSGSFRLALFSGLCFAQGAIMSYFLTFNILYLGEFGYGEADIGIFQAVLAVPFVLKILLVLGVFRGHRAARQAAREAP